VAPGNFPKGPGPTEAKPSGDHIPLGGFVRAGPAFMRRGNVRRYWIAANYFVAVALAMMGWLWLIVWMARRLI
jgi:hypothetical protein